MRVLVVGAGGREHALCAALAASPSLTALFCAPGNPGTARCARNVAIGVLDVAALVRFAREERIDLVVPGPEAPLVAGLADALEAAGIRCCGPRRDAARLEGSKAFCKEVCDAAGIPTALWEAFDDPAAARDFVRRRGAPAVIKADGLAAGKGVVVAATLEEAEAAIASLAALEAGATLIVEEVLVGEEVSLFALCDGEVAIPLGAAQDHKRANEGDTGPNTGGMGAYAPPAAFTPALQEAAMAAIVRPALAEMARLGAPFRGVLYAGLMLTAEGPKLIEFNVRFGDPEAQCLLPMLQGDLLEAFAAACDGTLGEIDLRWRAGASLAVVVAARGYPGAYAKGSAIGGLDRVAATPGALLFHAATRDEGGRIVADGGRVLTVCGRGDTLRAAQHAAYEAVAHLEWPQGFFRRDIGWRGLV